MSQTLTRTEVDAVMKTLPPGERVIPILHEKPDDDEYLGLRLVELWGRKLFPGVAEMAMITLNAGLRLSNGQSGDSWLPKYLCIGLGGGVGDEHGKGDGKSAASMLAELLGITDDPALKPILAYSLRVDDKAQDAPFNLATIIKNLHANGVDREIIRKMYRRWFDSLYLRFGGRLIFTDAPMPTLQSIALFWLASRYAERGTLASARSCTTFADAIEAARLTDEQADEVREIQRFVDRDVTSGALQDFDLGGLVRAMQFTGIEERVIVKDICMVLDAKAKVQRDFLAAQAHFRRAAYVDQLPVRVAVILDDNEQMFRAARTMDPQLAILIQQRSTGHVLLFGNQGRCLRPILARLRARERRKHGHTDRLPWETLTQDGTLPQVPEWYGFAKYGKVLHVFNSTIKAPRTRRTRLTLDEVVRCVRSSLTYHHR